jgi:hypothetical protein
MMISKSKQNQSNGSSSIPTNENETGADVWKKYENQQKASLKQSYIKIENNSANEDHQDKFQFETK